MQIFVKLYAIDGRTITLDVEEHDTVGSIRKQLHDQVGMPPCIQGLSFAGKGLESHRTLYDYKIEKESTLHLTIRMSGRTCICCTTPSLYDCFKSGFLKIHPSPVYDPITKFWDAGKISFDTHGKYLTFGFDCNTKHFNEKLSAERCIELFSQSESPRRLQKESFEDQRVNKNALGYVDGSSGLCKFEITVTDVLTFKESFKETGSFKISDGDFKKIQLNFDHLNSSNIKREDVSKSCDLTKAGVYPFLDINRFRARIKMGGSCFEFYFSHLTDMDKKQKKGAKEEDYSSVEELLKANGLEKYVSAFKKEEINLVAFKLLNMEDLMNLGLKLGPRKVLLKIIEELKK